MRLHHLSILALCTVGIWACDPAEEPASPGNTETLALERDQNGDLRYCESDDPASCVTVSNPNDCATLQIEVDTATGATCERCLSSAGEVTYERCDSTAIACTLVTAPEPDCVVCAHVDGPVLYSTCVPEEPEHCEYYPLYDDGGIRECERCYDRRGELVRDTCGPDCSLVACAAVECAPGYEAVVPPGECCPICVPVDRCDTDDADPVVCPDVAMPECPAGWDVVRDPTDCCSYYCAPRDCSDLQCPAVIEECAPGFHWGRTDKHCCGTCIPDDEPDYCQDDSQCGPGRYCSEPVLCESRCDAPSEGADPSMGIPCEADCYGVCRPEICPVYDAPAYYFECQGEWVDPGFDGTGCPRPPVCVCADGSISNDGQCFDYCELVDCVPSAPETCAPGEEWVTGFPYCCGGCVRKDRALCDETGGDWELGCGHTNCNYAVSCIVPEEGCNCGPRMSWVEGAGCVPDPSCNDGMACEYDGERYPDGSDFPSNDGCNQCFCENGQVICTEIACQQCWGAWTDMNGTCRAPNDGIYPASCCEGSNLCVTTGGTWDPLSCGDYVCGQPPACDAIVPGCDCGPRANYVPGVGCVTSETCATQGSCVTENGTTYENGAIWPKGDGCNNCVCLEGQIACTEAACTP